MGKGGSGADPVSTHLICWAIVQLASLISVVEAGPHTPLAELRRKGLLLCGQEEHMSISGQLSQMDFQMKSELIFKLNVNFHFSTLESML